MKYLIRIGRYTFYCKQQPDGRWKWALNFKATPGSKSVTLATRTAFSPWLAEVQADTVLREYSGESLPYSEFSQAGV
ncbi:MAG TPA: hypothetical protein VJZ27_15970, partial [Aggregatilineales bacterium]|nr:hypothetical protein [Aggregatilineales bacterium]